mmetsp:Transcript_33334/g.37865  ORF Transcript_33334/g.37865 Transcript_33334/m.37865 type:complete len:134 (-) Transcript_33334:234-635(-)
MHKFYFSPLSSSHLLKTYYISHKGGKYTLQIYDEEEDISILPYLTLSSNFLISILQGSIQLFSLLWSLGAELEKIFKMAKSFSTSKVLQNVYFQLEAILRSKFSSPCLGFIDPIEEERTGNQFQRSVTVQKNK